MKTSLCLLVLSISAVFCEIEKRDLLEILGIIHKDAGFQTLPVDIQLTIVELVAAAENGVLVRYVDEKGFANVLKALSVGTSMQQKSLESYLLMGPLGRRNTDNYLQHSILSSTAFQQLSEDKKEIIKRVLESVRNHHLSQTIFLQGIDFIQKLRLPVDLAHKLTLLIMHEMMLEGHGGRFSGTHDDEHWQPDQPKLVYNKINFVALQLQSDIIWLHQRLTVSYSLLRSGQA
uniref:Uncharacterized protein n=1 Tax=Magallana gigas TaxID=29159 RepID=K1RX09_MAGGI